MKHADVPISNSPLNGKSAEEILEHFKSYKFEDDHGHPLEFCKDFSDLIAMAVPNPA